MSQRFLSKNKTTAQTATAIATGRSIHVGKPSCSVACMVVGGVVDDGGEVGVAEGVAVAVGVGEIVVFWVGAGVKSLLDEVCGGEVGLGVNHESASEISNLTLSTAISCGPTQLLHQSSPSPDIKLIG